MRARALRGLAAATTALLLGTAGAEAPDAECVLPAQEADPLADRAGLLAQYEQLPRACLATLVQVCTDEASRTFLDLGSAATCSFGYEALLRKGFGGNFREMLAWWQSRREKPLP